MEEYPKRAAVLFPTENEEPFPGAFGVARLHTSLADGAYRAP